MRFAWLYLSSAIATALVTTLSARQVSDFDFLPAHNRFPVFSADPSTPDFSIQKMFGNEDLIGKLGATIPLAQFLLNNKRLQIDAATSTISFFQAPGGGLKVISTDFHFFTSASVEWTPTFSWRFGFGHTSHHLNDNALTRTPALTPTNYSRDYLAFDCLISIPSYRAMFYAGINDALQFHVSTNAQESVWILLGGVPVKVRILESCDLYAAFNLRFRQEFQFAATQNFQVGLEFASENGRVLRAALDLQTGKDNRGQFYDKPLDIATIGLYFDL